MAVVNNPKLYTRGFTVKTVDTELVVNEKEITIKTEKPLTLIAEKIIVKEEPVVVIDDLDKKLEEFCVEVAEMEKQEEIVQEKKPDFQNDKKKFSKKPYKK